MREILADFFRLVNNLFYFPRFWIGCSRAHRLMAGQPFAPNRETNRQNHRPQKNAEETEAGQTTENAEEPVIPHPYYPELAYTAT